MNMLNYIFPLVILLKSCSIALVEGGGCTKSLEGPELEKSRLQHLKDSIAAQLGSFEPPRTDLPPPTAEQQRQQDEIMQQYLELVSQGQSREEETPKCLSEDFLAKPVTTFTGTIAPSEGTPTLPLIQSAFCISFLILLLCFLSGSTRQYGADISGSSSDTHAALFEGSVLSTYTIHMDNMVLPRSSRMLSEANLLLHQSETDTLNQPVADEGQTVQISAIINNVLYFVDKKTLNVYEHGPRIFNVMQAMQTWLDEGAQNPIVLEVLVTCFSSPNCSNRVTFEGEQMAPATVSFECNSRNSSLIPRIVVVSKNEHEQDHLSSHSRRKRSADEFDYCNANQFTCCLHKFNISFIQDLGHKSITAPPYFIANFCNGHCATIEGAGTKERNRFLSYLRGNPSISVQPCCSGFEYERLPVLIRAYNPNTKSNYDIIKFLEQVIVTKCRCA